MDKKIAAKISIDNKDYLQSELSDDCKAEIQSLQFCESEISRLKAQLAIAGTARNAYRAAISKLLPKGELKEIVKH